MSSKRRKVASREWRKTCADARCYRDETLEFDSSLATRLQESAELENGHDFIKDVLDEESLNITSLDFDELVSKLSSAQISAAQVVNAYLRRAVVSQQMTNCLTELLYERAIKQGSLLDERQRNNTSRKPLSILHGVPFSVKEHIGLKGLRLHSGYVGFWDNKPPEEDALIVQILVRAGAIPFARTTEPQSMMQLETDSNLYGVTTNAINPKLSAGGSSGGEGALIGTGGSILGIGTDIGGVFMTLHMDRIIIDISEGSIRVPAAVNGIFGFKPSAFRIPTTGWSSTPPGADSIVTVVGPLSSSLEGIEAFMQVVIAAKPWLVEPALIPLPWTPITISPTPNLPLRLGIMYHDDVVLPHPPVTRGLMDLAERISQEIPEISIVPFKAYKHDEGWAIAASLYFPDGGQSDIKILEDSGEPMRPLVDWVINNNPCVKKLSRQELEYWNEEREEYRLEYAKYWNSTGRWDEETGNWVDCIDAVICPVAPWVAARHGTSKYWTYTAIWNLLDYSAIACGSFKIGRARRDVDKKTQREEFFTDVDRDIWNSYDVDGMPLGIQIVGRRYEDEKVLAISKYLYNRL